MDHGRHAFGQAVDIQKDLDEVMTAGDLTHGFPSHLGPRHLKTKKIGRDGL